MDSKGKASDKIEGRAGDDQIGVITLIRLIWKWKIVILAGIFGGALVGLLISVLIPHVYNVDMLVENVQIGTNKTGQKAYLGNLQNMGSAVGAGAFSQDILSSLREQYKGTLPKRISLKVSLENNKQFARISYETADVKMGEQGLSRLFKLLQETKLVRMAHWKKEISDKIEVKRSAIDKKKKEMVLLKKVEKIKIQKKKIEKQQMLDKAKTDKRLKEAEIKETQQRIDNAFLEMMTAKKADKDGIQDSIANLEKKNSEIKSNIRLVESEIEFLIKTRTEVFSKENEIRHIGVEGQDSYVILKGYAQLNELRQDVLDNDYLILKNRAELQELDLRIEKLEKEGAVTTSDKYLLEDEIVKERLALKALDLRVKELSDDLAMSGSAENPGSLPNDGTIKIRDKITLLEGEISAFETNKEKARNIVLLQSPVSGVSPLRPDTKRNVVIGAVVGLFLSLFLSVLLEYGYQKDV